jgi:hypothetical protein
MAILQGPLFSMEARGAIAKNLIYQNQKGKAIVKKFAIPKNPQSSAQVANRSLFSLCSEAWQNLGTASKATWDYGGGESGLSARNRFFAINLERLQTGMDILISHNPILNPLANNERLQVLRSGDYIYVRSYWSNTHDLVQRLDFRTASSSNEVATRFFSTSLCLTALPNSDLEGASFTSIGFDPSDDISPLAFNNGYIGGDHGWNRLLTSTTNAGHGLTAEDLGQEFSLDPGHGANCWVLARIISSTQAAWLNYTYNGSNGPASYEAMTGPLIGPYPTTAKTFAIDSQTLTQVHPSTRQISRSVLMDDSTLLNDGESRVCQSLDFYEDYEILRIQRDGSGSNMYDVILAHPGEVTAYDHPDVEAEATVEVHYHFSFNGACTVKQQIEHLFDAGLGYEGFIQQYGLTKPSGGSGPFMYVPKTIAFVKNGRNYDLTLTPVDISTGNPQSDLEAYDILAAIYADANVPPDRCIQYVKNSGGTKTSGHSMGYCPVEGLGIPSARKTLTPSACRIGEKLYPKGIADGGSAFPTYAGGRSKILANQVFNATTYRCPLNFDQCQDATNISWYELDDGSIILNLDFHESIDRLIVLPLSFTHKTITVIDQTADITIHDSTVQTEGLHVSTTTYGSATLQLT